MPGLLVKVEHATRTSMLYTLGFTIAIGEDTDLQCSTLVSDMVHVLVNLLQTTLSLGQVAAQQLLCSSYRVLQHHISLYTYGKHTLNNSLLPPLTMHPPLATAAQSQLEGPLQRHTLPQKA